MGFGSGFGGLGKLSDKVVLGSVKTVAFNDGTSLKSHSDFTFDKDTKTLRVPNLSGSLTALSDGSPYLRAGANITLTTGSGGWVTITSLGGGSSEHNKLQNISWSNSGHTGTELSVPTFNQSGSASVVTPPESGTRVGKVLGWISDTAIGWTTVVAGVFFAGFGNSEEVFDISEDNSTTTANLSPVEFVIGAVSGYDDNYIDVSPSTNIFTLTGIFGSMASNYNPVVDIVDPIAYPKPAGMLNVGDPIDSEEDGLTDEAEAALGTDPLSPDSDSDGLSDYDEVQAGSDPLNADTDDDGIADGSDPSPTDGSIT